MPCPCGLGEAWGPAVLIVLAVDRQLAGHVAIALHRHRGRDGRREAQIR